MIRYFTSVAYFTHEDSHTNTESPDVSEETVVEGRFQYSFICVRLVERIGSIERSQ